VHKAWITLLALLIPLGSAGCADQPFVNEIVIDNPTDYIASVDVTGPRSDGWLNLATTDAHSESTVQEVIDQGDTWVFRFGYSGYEEQVEVARAELAEAGWRVQVPDSFAAALRDRGVLPPP